jgi:branched-chain amino acid transport system substrate-binding protein
MKRYNVFFNGLLFTVLLTLMAGGGYAADKASAPIRIGIDLDLTGPIGPGGIDMEKGLRLGLEKLGDTVAGKKIVFIVEDNGSEAGVSVDKAKKLVETDKVAMIIGPINQGGGVAVSQYVERVHVPRFDGMGSSNEGMVHDWSFGPIGLEVQASYGAAIYAYDVLKYKTAVALAADFVPGHHYVEGFKEAFEAKGGKVLQETYYPEGTTNMVPFLTALKQADVLMYWGTPGDCFAMFPQYKELNMKMPILQPEDGGVTSSPGMLKNLGKAAIGTIFGTSYLYNANYSGNKEFVEAYQKKHNELPGVMAGVGYAHVQMILAVLKATVGNTKPDVLHKAIKGMSIDTVRGHLSFSPGAGPFGTVANLPCVMGKIGPDMEVIPILPVQDIRVNYKDHKFVPYVYQGK